MKEFKNQEQASSVKIVVYNPEANYTNNYKTNAIAFMTGWMMDISPYDNLLRHISNKSGLRVYAIDSPVGDKNSRFRSLNARIKAVKELFNRLSKENIEQVIIFAHSEAATYTSVFARIYEESRQNTEEKPKIEKLILIAPSGIAKTNIFSLVVRYTLELVRSFFDGSSKATIDTLKNLFYVSYIPKAFGSVEYMVRYSHGKLVEHIRWLIRKGVKVCVVAASDDITFPLNYIYGQLNKLKNDGLVFEVIQGSHNSVIKEDLADYYLKFIRDTK